MSTDLAMVIPDRQGFLGAQKVLLAKVLRTEHEAFCIENKYSALNSEPLSNPAKSIVFVCCKQKLCMLCHKQTKNALETKIS